LPLNLRYKGTSYTSISQLSSSELNDLYLQNIALFLARAISFNAQSDSSMSNSAYSVFNFESNILQIIPPLTNGDYQTAQVKCLVNSPSILCSDEYSTTLASNTLWRGAPSLTGHDKNMTQLCSPVYK